MISFTHIFFDFDGTICDTAPGICASMQHVCDHYSLPYGKDTFLKMIGPSLEESFTTFFKLPQSEIRNAIKVYRDYYSTKGMFECTPYDGIIKTIEALRSNGIKTYVATSKPELYTKQIAEKKNLSYLFDFIAGADMEEKDRINKIDVINYLIKVNNLENFKNTTLMVGDRNYDIIGGHKAGLKTCGVLWGFGNEKEFKEADADFIIKTPSELLNLLKQ